MVAPRKPARPKKNPTPAWHAAFLAMLPAIQEQARYAFRRMRPGAKEDAVDDVVCAACFAFQRLVVRGKADVACPSALAHFAIRHYRAGRRPGCKSNVRDISSEFCQIQKHITVKHLNFRNRETGAWEEILIEDRRAGPADTAAARIDVHDWFARMRARDRRIAQALAIGERTGDVAKRFRISPSCVSNKRLEFRRRWDDFQRDKGDRQDTADAAA
jgi:hypothetical protein